MLIEWGVRIGLLGALAASLAAAAIGLAARGPRARRAAHALMAAGSVAGGAASILFLIWNLHPLAIGQSPLLFGAPLVVDRLSAFFLLLLHLVSAMTAWFASTYGEDEAAKYPPRAVVPLTAVFGLGMQGVLLSSGVASFLLFWEAMSLSSFFLVMADGEEESRHAALLYLAVAQFGAGALIVGAGLLSGGDLAATFGSLPSNVSTMTAGTSLLALALVMFAFTSKAGLAPFHAWLPEAHPRAPSHISALMSGVMLKVAIYGLLRFTSVCWPELPSGWGIGLLVLGLGGAGVAVIYANLAREIKRVLAWSSVENIGLIFTMFGFQLVLRRTGHIGLADAVQAAMFLHIAAHALFKSGLFLGAGAIIHATHTAKIEALGGLANRMPWLSAAMLALSLAAAALPPFGAFVAEWLLLQSAVVSLSVKNTLVAVLGLTVLVGVAFVAGLAVFAMVRLFAFIFLAEPRSAAARAAHEPAVALRGPVIALSVAVLALGVLAPLARPLLPVVVAVVGPAVPPAPIAAVPIDLSLPVALGAALAVGLCGAWLIRRALGGPSRVRRYHTWDCGQPIDASMEYTATGFSAPVRFFLRDIVRAEKHLVFTPVAAANPWIRDGQMEFRKAAGVLERLYFPIARLIEGVGAWLKQLQNGVIQFYIALILATLLLTLWVAL
ncbi:MAG TPA: proton-conducting transporter membrane subunit [Vicinamibacterales bacterium]|jgi:formate hydrogenlyase subunit 3/multisubunit Na+/H+ antiporter MnhD subunit